MTHPDQAYGLWYLVIRERCLVSKAMTPAFIPRLGQMQRTGLAVIALLGPRL